jgi:hypothetical protein
MHKHWEKEFIVVYNQAQNYMIIKEDSRNLNIFLRHANIFLTHDFN